jgi:hypothetical protein
MRSAWGAAIAVVFAAGSAAAQTHGSHSFASHARVPGSDATALRNAAFAYKSVEVRLPKREESAAYDAVRVDVGQVLRTPVGVFDPRASEVTLVRRWPAPSAAKSWRSTSRRTPGSASARRAAPRRWPAPASKSPPTRARTVPSRP